jgi:L-threonylcarbamoyladenylate synthase
MSPSDIRKAIKLIKMGKVGVMPTDTIYGIVTSIYFDKSVERIYGIKGRDNAKPFVVLIGSISDLKSLDIEPNSFQMQTVSDIWPGQISAVLPCSSNNLEYLHRGYKSLAVRMPKPEWLREIINETGPIIATSANISGKRPLENISEIRRQMPGLDFYFEGSVGDKPSKLIAIDEDGNVTELRS